MDLTDILGIVGVVLALGNYILGSLGKRSFDSINYHLTELAACGINGTVMYMLGSLPFVGFNIAWAIVAITKLVALRRTPRHDVLVKAMSYSVMNANEVRARLSLPPIEGGGINYIMTSTGAVPVEYIGRYFGGQIDG